MRLPLFRGPNKSSKFSRVSSEDESSKASQKSLGLRGLLPQSDDATIRVLDLGTARTANLDFFSRYGGRLTVADFYSGLRPARAAATGDNERKAKAFAELLDYESSTRFDLILAWDLLNYLTPHEHELLMTTLEPFCLPGTALLAFVSTQKEMPPAPSVYWIRDEETLLCEVREGRPRPCPRYLEQDLLKRMPSLTVEYRYQLRNGMLEYVFSHRMSSRPTANARNSLDYRLSPAPRWTTAPSR